MSRQRSAANDFSSHVPSRIMAYDAQNLEGSGFEYPPLSDVYTDPYSSFCLMNAYSGHDAAGREDFCEPEPSFYPYYGHHRVASTTPPHRFSYPDDGLRVPDLEQIASFPSSAPLSEPRSSTFPILTDLSPSLAGDTKPRFISYKSWSARTKRPRGTTGSVVCDRCGYKFTVVSSLNRHSKICHGRKVAKNSSSTQCQSIKTTNVGFISDCNPDGFPIFGTGPTAKDGLEHDSRLPNVADASVVLDSLDYGNASLMSDSSLPDYYPLSPVSTQSYIPRGPDKSADHGTFFCDLCPGDFARQDLLQLHKARVHRMTNLPYPPDSGTIDTPPYLYGVTLENPKTKHSRAALRVFEGGALSSSPCRLCQSKGLDCIVNPLVSSKCAYCNHRSNGVYCGAAGVKYL